MTDNETVETRGNERVEPIVASDDDVQVRGVVIGLLRRYR